MACGSRPVERTPELGALPTVGINPGPGLPRGRPFPPWSAAVRRRWTDRQCLPGGTGSNRIKELARDLIPFDKLRANGCVDGWFAETSRRLSGRGEGERSRSAVRMTAKGSVTPWMACGFRPVERIPQLGAFPTVGMNPGPGLPRGQIGVWTGLIIPAPIWREGRDSPSGLRSHGWRSEAFSPLTCPRQRSVGKSPPPTGRNRIKQSPDWRVEY